MSERPPTVLRAALLSVCPRCGKAPLFDGYLRAAKTCRACGLDFGPLQTGDGPTGLVILLVGAIIAGSALLVEVAYQPPYWLHGLIWVPAILVLCLGLLRPFKAGMIAVQYRNRMGR